MISDDLCCGLKGGGFVVMHRPGNDCAIGVAGDGEGVVLDAFLVPLGDQGFRELARGAHHRAHAGVDGRADALRAIGVGSGFHRSALGNDESLVFGIMSDRRGRGDAVPSEETLTGELEDDRF